LTNGKIFRVRTLPTADEPTAVIKYQNTCIVSYLAFLRRSLHRVHTDHIETSLSTHMQLGASRRKLHCCIAVRWWASSSLHSFTLNILQRLQRSAMDQEFKIKRKVHASNLQAKHRISSPMQKSMQGPSSAFPHAGGGSLVATYSLLAARVRWPWLSRRSPKKHKAGASRGTTFSRQATRPKPRVTRK
jgi:hypothetical protein